MTILASHLAKGAASWVIDHEALTVGRPVAHDDLPAGGTRLMQPVSGYVASMVAGEVTRRNDTDTGARPGRLVRS